MKRISFVAIATLLFIISSCLPSAAATPDGKPKYASVNIYLAGLRPARVFTIMDGKVEETMCESGYMDKSDGELAVFGPAQVQLEKLAANGYKLQTTTSLAPSLIVYTLIKE
jgi:hypothetical protein